MEKTLQLLLTKSFRNAIPIYYEMVDALIPDFDQKKADRKYDLGSFNLLLTSQHVFQEEDIKINLQEGEKKVTNEYLRNEISIANQLLNCKAENERLRAIILKQSAQMTVAANFA